MCYEMTFPRLIRRSKAALNEGSFFTRSPFFSNWALCHATSESETKEKPDLTLLLGHPISVHGQVLKVCARTAVGLPFSGIR